MKKTKYYIEIIKEMNHGWMHSESVHYDKNNKIKEQMKIKKGKKESKKKRRKGRKIKGRKMYIPKLKEEQKSE